MAIPESSDMACLGRFLPFLMESVDARVVAFFPNRSAFLVTAFHTWRKLTVRMSVNGAMPYRS
jgi:hypothetical protein